MSRNVVLLAYRHLLAEGYARGLAGSGSYVAPELPDPILEANEGRVRAEAGEGDEGAQALREMPAHGLELGPLKEALPRVVLDDD